MVDLTHRLWYGAAFVAVIGITNLMGCTEIKAEASPRITNMTIEDAKALSEQNPYYLYSHVDALDEFIQTLEEDKQDLFTDEFIYELIKSCKDNDVDIWLALSTIQTESAYDKDAKAYDGSEHYGLMQLAVKYFECEDYFNPVENIQQGIKHLKKLIDKSRTMPFIKKRLKDEPDIDILYALMCYNRGEGNAIVEIDELGISSYAQVTVDRAKRFKDKFGEFDYAEAIKDKRISRAYLKQTKE